MTEPPLLRVLSFDLAGLATATPLVTVVRSLSPDVVLLQHGPRRLRWRTRGATLANRLGLVVGGGGAPAVGNLVLVNVRIAVHEAWSVQFPRSARSEQKRGSGVSARSERQRAPQSRANVAQSRANAVRSRANAALSRALTIQLGPGHLMDGAALVRGSVSGRRFVMACTAMSRRTGATRDAAILNRVLSEVDEPVVLGAHVGSEDSVWRMLAEGRSDAGAGRRTNETAGAIFVSPDLAVRDYREIAVAGASQPLIMVELALGASDDHGQMVSGSRSH